ncbi:MAG TPA: galactokinase [Propionibacteriaceae bacterium]|nr:galactokinase [Propionibacteriaceae bacterium]HQE31465.1 galactokinase [Propionibacteriaceae bacterium]
MDAVRLFRETFNADPEGVWESPGRVNLIGEHTDYNAGLVLPIALPQRTYAAASRRDDNVLRLVSDGIDGISEVTLDAIEPGTPSDWSRYPAGVVWALQLAGYEVGGMDVAFSSTVPIGAGLSSSAAIEGAMGAAASGLSGLDLLDSDESRARLAGLCQRAENEIALAPTGGMDQAASLRSLAGHALLLDCRDGTVTHQPFDLAEHGLALLVIDTRATHALVDGQYGERRASCERAAVELDVPTLREVDIADLDDALARLSSDLLRKRARHVVTEIDRVTQAVAALNADDYGQLGRLFVASHTSLRDDFEVSCAELDTAVDAALAAGALGARMTGGGFGGSAIALVREPDAAAITAAVADAFAEKGFTAPAIFTAVAAEGARQSHAEA